MLTRDRPGCARRSRKWWEDDQLFRKPITTVFLIYTCAKRLCNLRDKAKKLTKYDNVEFSSLESQNSQVRGWKNCALVLFSMFSLLHVIIRRRRRRSKGVVRLPTFQNLFKFQEEAIWHHCTRSTPLAKQTVTFPTFTICNLSFKSSILPPWSRCGCNFKVYSVISFLQVQLHSLIQALYLGRDLKSGMAPPSTKQQKPKYTKDQEEELLLQDFSRNVSPKFQALFYGNAFIVSSIPICKYVIISLAVMLRLTEGECAIT